MPCYDPRDNSPAASEHAGFVRGITEAQHNSQVAQLLCSVMKTIHPKDVEPLCNHIPGLKNWWTEHQERDRLKAMHTPRFDVDADN